MPTDYFTILGLTSCLHSTREVTQHFLTRRAQLLAQLDNRQRYAEVRRELDALYLAFSTLRDPARQQAYLQQRDGAGDPVGEIRNLIAASLESGLLRFSRRQAIIDRAAALGLTEFQAQLLIAQVQFGETDLAPLRPIPNQTLRPTNPRVWARVAGVGVLALAIFIGMLSWLGL